MRVVAIRFDTPLGGGTVPLGGPPNGGDESHLWRVPDAAVRAAAAYPLSTLSTDHVIRVIVELESDPPPATRVCVRALARGDHVLGDVPETPIECDQWRDGRCAVSFDVDGRRLETGGVDAHHAVWHWHWHSEEEPAPQDLGLSEHLLFVTIAPPEEPWSGDRGPSQHRTRPWLAPLLQACRWGRGATTRHEAAARVVESVFELGESRDGRPCLIYNGDASDYLDPGFGKPHWFDCERLIEDLAHCKDECLAISCFDGAAILVVFCNLLGCQLVPTAIEGDCLDELRLNLIQSIGLSSGQSPREFLLHVVALEQGTASGDPAGHVYDASLRIDCDPQPSREPATFILARGIPLGSSTSGPGENTYLPQLVARESLGYCRTRVIERPWVGTKPTQESVDVCPLTRYAWYLWELQRATGGSTPLLPSPWVPEIAGYRREAIYVNRAGVPRRGLPRKPLASRFLFRSTTPASGHAIRVDCWADKEPWIVQSFMAELLAMSEVPLARVRSSTGAVYSVARRTSLLVFDGGIAARYVSVGPAPLDLVHVYASLVGLAPGS